MSRSRETEYGKGDDDRTESHSAFREGFENLDWGNDPERDAKREEERKKERAGNIGFWNKDGHWIVGDVRKRR